MPSAPPPGDTYTHGHHDSVVARHAQRTVEKDAPHLIPHLRPGLRLLDVGCGPGTITQGLARAVAPGECIGLDLEPAILEKAAELAEVGPLEQLRFTPGSVYELPFDEAKFDVAHAHQVLQHLTRPVDALHEILRVLKPGGLIALRESDYATMVSWPRSELLEEWLALYHAVVARNGAEADAGRHLQSWLREAGFASIEIGGTAQVYTGAQAVDWGTSWAQRILHSNVATKAQEYGLATRDDLQRISDGWERWAYDPEAVYMYIHVEALARRPA